MRRTLERIRVSEIRPMPRDKPWEAHSQEAPHPRSEAAEAGRGCGGQGRQGRQGQSQCWGEKAQLCGREGGLEGLLQRCFVPLKWTLNVKTFCGPILLR